MDCNELVELITDYLENTLQQADRERFDAHLKECPFCVIYVEQMRATLAALGTVPTDSLSDEARELLLQTFRDLRKT